MPDYISDGQSDLDAVFVAHKDKRPCSLGFLQLLDG